jgi:hypothetical protein
MGKVLLAMQKVGRGSWFGEVFFEFLDARLPASRVASRLPNLTPQRRAGKLGDKRVGPMHPKKCTSVGAWPGWERGGSRLRRGHGLGEGFGPGHHESPGRLNSRPMEDAETAVHDCPLLLNPP